MTPFSIKTTCFVQLATFAALGGMHPVLGMTLLANVPATPQYNRVKSSDIVPLLSHPVFLEGEVQGHMDMSTLLWNNLGGMGPEFGDAPVIGFKNCATIGDQSLDLVIWNTTTYTPNQAYRNGRGADDEYPFGMINLECGSSVGLNYTFRLSGTETPVVLQKMWFTFMDLDTGNRGEAKEIVAINTDIKSVHVFPDLSEIVEVSTDAGRAWEASVPGTGNDNPTDPMHLTVQQKKRTITFELENASNIPVTFTLTTRNDGTCQSNSGRNFVWAFKSLLVSKCTTCAVNSQGISTCCAEGGSWHRLCGSETQLAKGTRYYSYDEGQEICRTPTPTPSPTPLSTKGPRTPAPTSDPGTSGDQSCATCVIWGDPHIITFEDHKRRKALHPLREEFFRTRGWKSDQISINEAGTFWLVSSDRVQIQGLYERDEVRNMTSLASLAIGGSFLDGNILAIRPLGSMSLWNGEEILSSVESQFHNDFVSATSHKAGKMVKDGTLGPAMDVQLPNGVSLVVNRWHNSLAAEISLCPGDAAMAMNGQCALHADEGQ